MRVRHVLRRLLQLPLFTTAAVVTLAVGIGANTAIFSVVEGVLLKPLPFADPGSLVALDHAAPGVNMTHAGAAPFLYYTYVENSRTLRDVALWRTDAVTVTGLGDPEEVRSLETTASFLQALAVQPAMGRLFDARDDVPDGPLTTVLTNEYWRTRFGADPGVVGRPILLDGRSYTIIGVLPPRFRFLETRPALLTTLQFDRAKTFLGNFSYQGIARLKPGVSLDRANADAARLMPAALRTFPPFKGFSLKMFEEARITPSLHPLKDDLVGELRPALWILMGTIGMVLLIACANVANLLLVRADSRQQELAIRAALGAGWAQIARELLVESLALAALGGAPANLPRVDDIGIDGTVLLFTAAASLGAGLLFGSAPVLKYGGPQLSNALRAGGRTLSDSRDRHRMRSILVVLQVALALVLLVSAGLMIRTFRALKDVRPGFQHAEELQTFRLSIPSAQVKDPQDVIRMEQAIVDRLASLNGVTSVALSSGMPMTGDHWSDPIFAADHPYQEGQVPPLRRFRMVSPGLFQTMGNVLVAGRDFTWDDVYQSRRVTIVSENLARELWKEPAAALGKQIRETTQTPWREIVGVVADERNDGVNQPAPTTAFFPILMDHFEGSDVLVRRSLTYVVRSPRAGSRALLDEISRAVWSVNSNLPLASVKTVQESYEASLARTSFTLVMLAIAGGMALLLGLTGIYGVIAYTVAQRRREIGIRMALGARRAEVMRLFVGHGLRLALVGVAVGVVAAVALTRLMATLLFGVSVMDPITYGGVCLALVGATLLASYLPTLRALSVDPARALRAE